MNQFVCRFRLATVQPFRLSQAPEGSDPRTLTYADYTFTPAAQVKFDAEKGDPFGSATPYGLVDMQVHNPDVVEPLLQAYHDFMRNRAAGSKPPLFEVTFKQIEE